MFFLQVIYYNRKENTVSLHAWCKFGSKSWNVPHNEVWVWVCQICVWLHLKLAPWLNMTEKEFAEVSSHAIAENVTNEWLTGWDLFSVCAVFGHHSPVWEGWHAWSPNLYFMCYIWNMSRCKSEATVKRYFFLLLLILLSVHCMYLNLCQNAKKFTVQFCCVCSPKCILQNRWQDSSRSVQPNNVLYRTEDLHLFSTCDSLYSAFFIIY